GADREEPRSFINADSEGTRPIAFFSRCPPGWFQIRDRNLLRFLQLGSYRLCRLKRQRLQEFTKLNWRLTDEKAYLDVQHACLLPRSGATRTPVAKVSASQHTRACFGWSEPLR